MRNWLKEKSRSRASIKPRLLAKKAAVFLEATLRGLAPELGRYTAGPVTTVIFSSGPSAVDRNTWRRSAGSWSAQRVKSKS